MNKILMDEVDVNRIALKAAKSSESMRGAQDGSYEASIYYYVCQGVRELREALESSVIDSEEPTQGSV